MEPLRKKAWDMSPYELNRLPYDTINNSTEITVSSGTFDSEFKYPICFDLLKKTMTTEECLHRFCYDCIVASLRWNRECPKCRKKLVSKRSLRPDSNFDSIISKLYPNRDEYETHQKREFAEFKKNHSKSQAAMVKSIMEGITLQAQHRQLHSKRHRDTDGNANVSCGVNSASTSTLPNKRGSGKFFYPDMAFISIYLAYFKLLSLCIDNYVS